MGLTEVPSELFRMKNVKNSGSHQQQALLAAERNCAPDNARGALCAIVEAIWRDLTTGTLFSGRRQPAHVSSARARSADQSQELDVRHSRQMDLDLTHVTRFQVGDNQLTSLPAEIGQLTQLEWLSVRNSN
jgi:Leucine-rich repeat (LRR) protein